MNRFFPLIFLAAAFALIVALDQPIMLFLAEDRLIWLRDLASNFTDLAAAGPWLGIAAFLTFMTFFAIRHWRLSAVPELRNLFYWSFHLLMAFLGQGLALHVIKNALGRARPCIFLPMVKPLLFKPFLFHYDYNSFPSGHTQVIFCLAAFLAILFPRTRNPAFLLAFLIAFTRVLVLKHFPSDVFGGALLGIFGSNLSIRLWSRWVPAPESWRQGHKKPH